MGSPHVAVAPVVRTGAGTPIPVEVTVRNTGERAQRITVALLGTDTAWLPAPVTTPLLAPGASHTVPMTLHPAAGTLPARYPFAVTAQALDPAGRAAGSPGIAEAALVVDPRAQLHVELEKPRLTALRSARLRVLLHNSGGTPAQVRLRAQSSQAISVSLPDGEVEVAPGQHARVAGRVRVRRPRLVRPATPHSFRVTAAGTEAARHADGVMTVRGLFAPFWFKAVALLAVLAVWVTAAVVLLPVVSREIGDRGPTEVTVAGPQDGPDPGDGAGGEGGAAEPGEPGAGGDGDPAPDGGSDDGAGEEPGAAAEDEGIQLNGTITADDPGGVSVTLAPTSLVDEEAIGAIPVGVPIALASTTGKRAMTATLLHAPARTPATRGAVTSDDGAWSFPAVTAPGYYLLTFAKPGYQTVRYVVDSTTAVAAEPLKVALEPGTGTLSGRITGPSGRPVGGATVVISDGTNSITASSTTKGDVGHWSVSGLSTPASYVVTATKRDLSMEAKLARLPAGGSSKVDLRLRSGVATLTGTVRAPTSTGAVEGAGGVTVTVTGSAGDADVTRTSTTVTETGLVGTYHVPALPTPGRYTVTISGDGYLPRTSRLVLRAGDSSARLDTTLNSATGVVEGVVTDEAGGAGLSDVGLVLTDGEHTYKTMTTSEQPGRFRINGIEPGSYTLTTQLFGYGASQLAVTVDAGQTVTVDPVVRTVAGGMLPATASIVGAVLDGTSHEPVECPTATECLEAVVTDPATGDGSAPATSYDTRFGPSETYTLPEDPDQGLRPGMHTVFVTAPGYERTAVKVEVPVGARVTAPTAELMPAPKLRGNVFSTYAPSGPTCVWAVQEGFTDALPACEDAIDDEICLVATPSYDVTVIDPQAICAVVPAAGGHYEITVPSRGGYELRVASTDPEFYGPPGADYALDSGEVRNADVRLVRLGVLELQVRKPLPSGDLAPAGGVDVTVTPLSPGGTGPTPGWPDTDSEGLVEIRGFKAGNYRIVATDPDDATVIASRDLYVGENTVTNHQLNLVQPIGSLVGRVTWVRNGVTTPVSGAQVTGTFPSGYFGNTPTMTFVEATTQDGGCWGVRSASLPVPTTAQCGPDGLSGAALPVREILAPTASTLKVEAAGFEVWQRSPHVLQGWNATAQSPVNQIVLTPLPVTLAVTMADTSIDWTSVEFVVESVGANPTRFAMAADADGTLHFTDATLGIEDEILPGRYTVTPSAPGYTGASGVLDCEPAVGCDWVSQPQLTELGSISGTLVGVLAAEPETMPYDELANVTVHARRCATPACTSVTGPDHTGVTNGSGSFTISGPGGVRTLAPGDYRLTASVAGFHAGSTPWTVSVVGGGDVDAGTLELWVDPVELTVTLQNDQLESVTGPSLTLLDGTAEVATGTVEDSAYVFTGVIPGNYTLRAEGSTLRTQTMQLSVVRGDPNQETVMPVTLGAVVTGQVTTLDGTASVPVEDVEVTLLCTAEHLPICPTVGGAVVQAGVATVQTDGTGRYTIRNVPDGTFQVGFAAVGYVAQTSGALPFDHQAAPIRTVNATLEPVTHTVTLTVTPSVATNPLTGATLELTKGGTTLSATSWADLGGGEWEATFLQVPHGCWTPSLELDLHYGSLGSVAPAGSCAAGRIAVPQAATAGTVAASAGLDEAPIDLSVTTTPAAPHTAAPSGSSVEVTVSVAGDPVYTGAATELWLPVAATYAASASLVPSSPFWPTGPAAGGTVPAAGEAVELTLSELAQDVTVRLPGAGAGVEVTAEDAVSGGTVTGTTGSNGRVVLALPQGSWTIDAEGYAAANHEVVELDAVEVALEADPTPPPGP